MTNEIDFKKKEQARFCNLPMEIQLQSLEYYALFRLKNKRDLTVVEINRFFDLLDIVIENDVTPISIADDLCI